MPKTAYFGEDSEPTAKPESNHKFTPTEEMVKKHPWIKTRRDHIRRYRMADPTDKNPWLTIDFGKVKEFNKITTLEKYNRIKSYRLEYERDGKWVEFYKGNRLDNISPALPTPIKAQKCASPSPIGQVTTKKRAPVCASSTSGSTLTTDKHKTTA